MVNNVAILDLVRRAVARVTSRDLTACGAEEPLNLDSISRITLLVELENALQMPIDTSAMTPEVFESLSSLTRFVGSQP